MPQNYGEESNEEFSLYTYFGTYANVHKVEISRSNLLTLFC